MKKVFALVDCNNFYASCEQVFAPRLRGKPIVVLSNNDGCIVARSKQARALGIGMGVPAFEAEDILKKHNVEVLSSNYALYADMSGRVMETLSTLTPRLEIYSIDEAFLDLTGMTEDRQAYGHKIRDRVRKWTGLEVSVGIGRSKTLAKVANKLAKRSAKADGVLDLTDSPWLDQALEQIKVEDVWCIGHASAKALQSRGITTARALRNTDIAWIRKRFGVNGVRTVYELRQVDCYKIDDNPPAKQGVTVSRSFGQAVEQFEPLCQAVATFVTRAAEKLRQERQAAQYMTIFVMTNRFSRIGRYFNSETVRFLRPTSDTGELLQEAMDSVRRLFREGYRFKRAGVILQGLVDENKVQGLLFDPVDRFKSHRLMQAIDGINNRPDLSIRWAAQGLEQPSWQSRCCRRSKRYTTCW
ncbi:MAG: Y-family DNA polymerase, partial [Sedimentisphaerales bacterium]|nr:Y-family DNA polymerase [Sedimentisphaerales bacterium]